MIIKLTYSYKIKESDGVGTSNDALVVAVRALQEAIDYADSTDDLGEIFDVSYESA